MAEAAGSPALEADCATCFGLCCVLLPFRREGGFGADKPGGRPCRNLGDDDRCRIHRDRVEMGWPACVRFDCRGAGQFVSQVTYAGRSWRAGSDPDEMAAVFSVVLELHTMLALLAGIPAGGALAERIGRLRGGGPEQVMRVPVDELWAEVDALERGGAAVPWTTAPPVE